MKVTFERKNTNVAGGDFSFKTTDEQGKEFMIMTPTMMSEAYLGEISPVQVLVVDDETGCVVDGIGQLTRKINLHKAVYASQPQSKAVLHAYAPKAMFWATSGIPIPNLTEATQKVHAVPVMEFVPNCSEELAEITSSYIQKNRLEVPHMLLFDSHGVLINTPGETGLQAIHKALQILDTMEWNAEIAYKQAIFQAIGLMDGFYSKGRKIGTLADIQDKKALYNQEKIAAGGD